MVLRVGTVTDIFQAAPARTPGPKQVGVMGGGKGREEKR